MNKTKTETILELRSLLTAQLNDPEGGRVLCEITPVKSTADKGVDPHFLLMPVFRKHGLTTSTAELVEIPRTLAERVAEDLFRGPLVGPQKRSELEAQTVASLFFCLFDQSAQFYSTFKYKIDPVSGHITYVGSSLLGSSLESGFFVVDSAQVGCLLVGDED